MNFFLLIYFNDHPLRVWNRLTVHHQEVFYCICSIYSKIPSDDERLIYSKHVDDDH